MLITYSYLSSASQQFISDADTIIVGRVWRNQTIDLDLTPDNTVSRRHACFSLENGTCWVEDLGSTGGTWVNGQKIALKTQVTPEDTIVMGQTTLRVRLKAPQPMPQAMDETPSGVLTSSVSATDSPSALLLAAASVEIIKRRLTAFYELGAALGTIETVERLLQTVIDHLRRAIPHAQRGALLLPDEVGLTPRAYAPEHVKPSFSLNLARKAVEEREAFIWRFDLEDVPGPFESVILHRTQCAIYAPLIWKEEVLGVVLVDNSETRHAFTDDDLRLLMAMASQAAMFVKNHALQQELRRQEVVRSNLLRQFSPQVAERLERMLKDSDHWHLGGNRADPVTILVSDVRGFTSLSARMEPDEVVEMLNELFRVCIPIIFKYNGAVDKFVGDSILAVFGSPEADERQWVNAVRAALEMQQAIKAQQSEWLSRKLPICRVGIGIHTGAVLHGFIGATERMEYTVIGDTVNRATRYCDGAGKDEVIISPEVYAQVKELVEVAPKLITTKHPEVEPDLPAYVVKAWKLKETARLPAGDA
jgi:adenylate cyclase